MPANYRTSPRLQPPSPTSNPKRPNHLNLSGLPRFHPANFPSSTSATSSTSTTPSSNLSTPASPPSYRQHYPFQDHRRQISDAQRHLFAHQRENVNLHFYHAGGYSPVRSPPLAGGRLKPASPRLDPLGSPGPVTPLELEQGDGYLFAAAPTGALSEGRTILSEQAKDEIVENYIRKETQSSSTSPLPDTRQSGRGYVGGKRGDYTKHRSNLSQ